MTIPHASPDHHRIRMGAVAFALAGILFAVYETVAPRTDESTLDGAASWASAGWSIAHISAIVGLILIPLGYGAIRGLLDGTPHERTAFLAATIGYVGSGLTISYYGAEAYGLRAIGQRAVADGDASLTDVGNDFRLDPIAMSAFAIGLLLVAIAAVLAAIAVWRSGSLPRWSGVPPRSPPGHHAPAVLPAARGADRLGSPRRRRSPLARLRALARGAPLEPRL